jgi:hypothetical protein
MQQLWPDRMSPAAAAAIAIKAFQRLLIPLQQPPPAHLAELLDQLQQELRLLLRINAGDGCANL